MKCKDIPDDLILEFLYDAQERIDGKFMGAGWHNLFPREDFCPTLRDVIPLTVPDKLLLAKMRKLISRGLVSGCGCGCRGDFCITNKGKGRFQIGIM